MKKSKRNKEIGMLEGGKEKRKETRRIGERKEGEKNKKTKQSDGQDLRLTACPSRNDCSCSMDGGDEFFTALEMALFSLLSMAE